jgi:hypothetical protein
MYSSKGKGQIILDGVRYSLVNLHCHRSRALILAVVIRLVEKYTGWFNLGDERNNWLFATSLYWATLPAIFLGIFVLTRVLKSGSGLL